MFTMTYYHYTTDWRFCQDEWGWGATGVKMWYNRGMLELKGITKIYKTGGLKQKALDGVTLNFRNSEFVSVLGPSGSGKTTLLNIIGGLDRYDSGELKINEVSTRDFRDRDWDSYRNHRVGFVFQAYNLISHQSVLANVEIALTLSGVKRRERKRRAKAALTAVGLKEHMHKKPAQLSGGQMQRVAIARALINNPDILLADEPTGALDTETSVQIMNLLAKVAKNKLVVMVTHNPELARRYSTRIVKLQDGKILADTRPYDGQRDTREELEVERKKSKKTSMGLLTALSLSFNNLKTKMGRTILTAFAGSIGIIGIAMILALSNGIQNYINRTEKEALSNYPLTIERQSLDMGSFVATLMGMGETEDKQDGKIHSVNVMGSVLEAVSGDSKVNDLKSFADYIESDEGEAIREQTLLIDYNYNVPISIYSEDGKTRVNPTTVLSALGMDTGGIDAAYGSMMSNYDVFVPYADDNDGPMREVLDSRYEKMAGRWPEAWNEVVIITNEVGDISDYSLYSMGLLSQTELRQKFMKMVMGEPVKFEETSYDPEELIGMKYQLAIPDAEDMTGMVGSNTVVALGDNAEELTVVGVMKDVGGSRSRMGGVGYTTALTRHLAETLGLDLSEPDEISLYPKDFDAKAEIVKLIDEYNANLPEDEKLSYTDTVEVLMSSVSAIVDVVSAVLIAFVAISLVVSSIMIAIITYVSVLERTKEIGILRAVGARKRDISRVFNAETLIEGLAAGLIGIGVTILLCIPANIIIESVVGIEGIAELPMVGALILIAISVALTVIAGLIPAKIASRKDPVEALRSE